MGFFDVVAQGNQPREGRGHDSFKDAAKRRAANTKTGRKVSETREKAARVSESAKTAAGKDGRCAECKGRTKNGWVCSAACSKKAGRKL